MTPLDNPKFTLYKVTVTRKLGKMQQYYNIFNDNNFFCKLTLKINSSFGQGEYVYFNLSQNY